MTDDTNRLSPSVIFLLAIIIPVGIMCTFTDI